MLYVDVKKTGENIDALRKSKGLSITQLSEAMDYGASYQAVYKWVTGHNLPSIDNLVVLASLLDTSMDDIIVVERR